jgi:hypothetical protein
MDAMWQFLMDLLPDLDGTNRFEIGSMTELYGLIVSLVVLAFTVWVALRQLRIMNLQTQMMHEQSKASKRQESIALEQGAIAKRQADIAETQHHIMQDQLARRSQLSLELHRSQEEHVWHISIRNEGSRSSAAAYWLVGFPLAYVRCFEVEVDEGELDMDATAMFGDVECSLASSSYLKPLFAGSSIGVATLKLKPLQLPLDQQELAIFWRLTDEDGVFPGVGMHETLLVPLHNVPRLTKVTSQ